MKKLLVTEAVTMAWNDHRITLENDDVKMEIQVKNTINVKDSTLKELLGLKRGDSFGSDEIKEVKAPRIAKAKKEKVITPVKTDSKKTETAKKEKEKPATVTE